MEHNIQEMLNKIDYDFILSFAQHRALMFLILGIVTFLLLAACAGILIHNRKDKIFVGYSLIETYLMFGVSTAFFIVYMFCLYQWYTHPVEAYFSMIGLSQMPFSQKPVVCINGSRTINDINLDTFLDPKEIGCVISGGADGVDTLAEKWAKRHKVEFLAFPAQWDLYGKSAGMRRNEDMARFCDRLESFWDGKSHGTKHMIDFMESLGKTVHVHIIESLD